mgnify:CR=1 FL=1
MPRLAVALCVIAHAYARQETGTAATIAEKKAQYVSMKAEYVAEGCEDNGCFTFPSANATTSTAEAYSRARGGMGCKCGMLYGLASSLVLRAEDAGIRAGRDVLRDREYPG